MLRSFCKSKIMNCLVTEKKLYYSGSIGIDQSIIEKADILPGEKVQVLNVNNGERFFTYVISEKKGSGKIILYGPAARLGEQKDALVILSYCMLEDKEAVGFSQRVVKLKDGNKLKK